jgi:hypothetical protein
MSIKVMKLLQQMNHSSEVLNVGHLHVVCFLPPAIKKPGLTKKANDPMAQTEASRQSCCQVMSTQEKSQPFTNLHHAKVLFTQGLQSLNDH